MAAQEFERDCVYLLPSQFLTDDDIIMDFAGGAKCGDSDDGLSLRLSGFESSGSSVSVSDLGSPVIDDETVTKGWNWTGDEEQFVAARLNHRLPRLSIDDNDHVSAKSSKGCGLPGSPQSVFVGCCCGQIWSTGSWSPVSFDLWCTGVGEVASMKSRRGGGTGFFDSSKGLFYSPGNHKCISNPWFSPNKETPNQGSWKQENLAGQVQNPVVELGRGSDEDSVNGSSRKSNHICPPSLCPLSGWRPCVRRYPGCGMRPMFLDSSGSKREHSGTGVFLPKANGLHRKPCNSCLTVLVPAKVIQALNNMSAISDFRKPSPDFDVLMRTGRNNSLQFQSSGTHLVPGESNVEVQLPQEWTY